MPRTPQEQEIVKCEVESKPDFRNLLLFLKQFMYNVLVRR